MSGGGSDKTVVAPTLPQQYRKYTNRLLGSAFGTLGRGLYGPLGTAPNAEMTASWDMAKRAAQTQLPDLQRQGSQIFGSLASMGDWQNNPALQAQMQQVAQNATEAMRENILPALRTGAVQAGQTGSSRQGIAEGLAARDTARQIGQQQTGLLSNAYQQALGANQAALGFMPQMQQATMLPSSVFGQIGEQQRGLTAERLDRQLQRLTGLSNVYGGAVGPLVGQVTSTPTQPSLLQKLFG